MIAVTNIGELVTGEDDGGEPVVIKDAAVVCENELLSYAGPMRNLPRLAGDTLEVDANGAAVIPGFVDSHTHLIWMGDRREEYAQRAAGASYQEISRNGGGIRSTIAATAAAAAWELAETAQPRLRSALRNGTTTVEIKTGYGGEHDAEMRSLQAITELQGRDDLPGIVATYLPLHAWLGGNREEFLAGVCTRGVEEAARTARFADAFCEQGAFTVDECRRLAQAAEAHGLKFKLHAEQLTHSGGAQLAAEIRATSADHLEHATSTDLAALAAAGVVATLLPGPALVLGGPPPPGKAALEAGCAIALATDCNPGTCYSESMPLAVSLGVAVAGLTPWQALRAATHGGALALNLHDRGLLRPGMRGDLLLLRSRHWLDVAYHLGADIVGAVIRGGRLPEL